MGKREDGRAPGAQRSGLSLQRQTDWETIVDVKWLHYKCNKRYTGLGVKLPLEYYLNYGLFD